MEHKEEVNVEENVVDEHDTAHDTRARRNIAMKIMKKTSMNQDLRRRAKRDNLMMSLLQKKDKPRSPKKSFRRQQLVSEKLAINVANYTIHIVLANISEKSI